MNTGRGWTGQRVATFRDRTEESALVARHVELARTDAEHLVVFEVLGVAGAGKSRFLAEVAARARADQATPISVSLTSEAVMTAVAPLLAIRNELPLDCWLFDTALLAYWAEADRSDLAIGAEGMSRAEQVATEIGVPLDFAAAVYASLPPDRALSRGYSLATFAEIDALRARPEALLATLPQYLGRDVRSRLRSPELRGLVVLYDAYDMQDATTLAERAPWLRAFIAAAGAGVHIVAARDPLGWEDGPWGAVQRVALGALPEVECRRLIRRELGELSRDVEDRLIRTSRGLAFYLYAAIGVCRAHLDEHGSVRADELPGSPPEVVERLLDHLAPAERRLALVLGGLQYFDVPLYRDLVRAFDLTDGVVGLDDFVEWFFVANVDEGLYRTHDLLTEAVRASGELRELNARALHVATLHLVGRSGETRPDEVERRARLFHAVVAAWQSLPTVSTPDAELLVDIAYGLYDAGYWDHVVNLPVADGCPPTHPARLLGSFFRALTARRREGADRGLEQLAPLAPHIGALGRHETSFRIEAAYLREISGDYPRARREFRQLAEGAVPFDPTDRAHVRARLYHADMLTMDGRFVEASRWLLDTYEQLDHRDPAWAELVRHRGHALRFSLDLEGAERLYDRALRVTTAEPAMQAKLRTNLAEALCWIEPDLALDEAVLAADMNTRLGSVIELAKVEAARAVALAGLDRCDEGAAACDRALSLATTAGYPAGRGFALQAMVAVAMRAGDRARADTAYRELATTVSSLDTYIHLCVTAAHVRHDAAELARRAAGVDWLAPDDLATQLARLMRT
jgi:hypothetical protein